MELVNHVCYRIEKCPKKEHVKNKFMSIKKEIRIRTYPIIPVKMMLKKLNSCEYDVKLKYNPEI